MTKAATRRALTLAAAVGVIALGLAGCSRGDTGGGDSTASGSAASPGITDTSITIGITSAITGTTAGPGGCVVAGFEAYMGAANAAGGIKFGDGKTRTVTVKTYDDAYDPQKSLANFQQMESDGVFAEGIGLGTPTNQAFRQQAIKDGVPQVLVMTGDPTFSDPTTSPWQLGFVPVYQQEGAAFGQLLASDGKPHKVAIIEQNDDYGKGYVEGLKTGIGSSSNVQIVSDVTYEPTDQSLDSQITTSANTGADVLFNAVSITPLVVAELQKAQSLGWKPSWFMPSNTSSPGGILTPGGAVDASGSVVYPGIYSVSFAASAASPTFSQDPNAAGFFDAMQKYASYSADQAKAFPHCVWSYIAGATMEQAFEKMTAPTRDAFMTALRSISNFDAPFMLPGTTIDTTKAGSPAVSSVVVQKFNGKGYDNVTTFG